MQSALPGKKWLAGTNTAAWIVVPHAASRDATPSPTEEPTAAANPAANWSDRHDDGDEAAEVQEHVAVMAVEDKRAAVLEAAMMPCRC